MAGVHPSQVPLAAAIKRPHELPPSCDMRDLLRGALPELDFILPGLLRGTVGAVIGPGGVGKSFWAMQLALSMAAGVDLVGLKPKRGAVLYLSGEDAVAVHAQRLRAMTVGAPSDLDLSRGLDLRVLESQLDIMVDAVFQEVLSAAQGKHLVVLDTLARFHLLDENNAGDMKRVLGQLERLARISGAAVLFLHHTSKAAALAGLGGQQQAARGSSVLVDNARWSCFVAGMADTEARKYSVPEARREHFVRWNISKQNYGAARPDVWYQRNAAGVLCTHGALLEPTSPFVELAQLPTDTEGRPLLHQAARARSARVRRAGSTESAAPSTEAILARGLTSQSTQEERQAHAAAMQSLSGQPPSAKGAFGNHW